MRNLRYGLILLAGIAIRLSFVLPTKFPLNDGGLFLSMIQDIEAQGGKMPIFTTYNGLEIPFVYPPLGFYIVSILKALFSYDSIGLITYLPPVFSCLTLFAFIPVAQQWLKRDREIMTALLLFAFMPRSFIWMIMGGGLTRALGFVFALLTIAWGSRLYTTGHTRYGILCAIAAALTALSHLEKVWFAAFSLGLLFVLQGRNRRAFVQSILVILLVILFTAPWWIFVLQNHGLEPFVSAFLTGSSEWELWPPMLRYLMLGILGTIVCLRRKEYFLPLWLPLVFLLDPRSAPTIACVPLSILMSIGIWYVLYPSWGRLRRVSEHVNSRTESLNLAEIWPFSEFDAPGLPRTLDRLLVFFAVLALLSFGIDYFGASVYKGTLHTLEGREIRMMAWIHDEIRPDRTFLILSGETWQKDEVSEWFPALTGRRSLATVQGYEWTSASRFYDQWQAYRKVQICLLVEDLKCILDYRSESGEVPDYLYYSTTRIDWLNEYRCCDGFEKQLLESSELKLIHREGDTMLFEILPGAR